jgi:hypothetical protein
LAMVSGRLPVANGGVAISFFCRYRPRGRVSSRDRATREAMPHTRQSCDALLAAVRGKQGS